MFDIQIAEGARAHARDHEANLPKWQRKELGQFFTGLRIGKVLAHLAIEDGMQTVLDPMVGSGDLLDAAFEAATAHGQLLKRLDGIEIDVETAQECISRLKKTSTHLTADPMIIFGDAFEKIRNKNIASNYDLVITNPPYVRYQSLKESAGRIRSNLKSCVEDCNEAKIRDIWLAMVTGYSGFADLSVPSWILSAFLVRPGGRLAIVAPATWRTRSYADVIRYMLLRCFSVEAVVEDCHPGWFSDALVRTNLIVARRLDSNQEVVPLVERQIWASNPWVQISSTAASRDSVIGRAFRSDTPEREFSKWVYKNGRKRPIGISRQYISHEDECCSILGQFSNRPWLRKLEGNSRTSSRKSTVKQTPPVIPGSISRVLPFEIPSNSLTHLKDSGINVGQGLRTGCNRFFYVEMMRSDGHEQAIVRTNKSYGHREIPVPASAVRSVLHRQSDVPRFASGEQLSSCVLNLRQWALPEDQGADKSFQTIPDELAEHIRQASYMPLEDCPNAKTVMQLSAVKTNVRSARNGLPPSYWYMLPDFGPRHQPQACAPRIIHDIPVVYPNSESPVLVDANFSTFWSEMECATNAALSAFLNSIWCRVMMEATGTIFGGGALKLEAAHLRDLPVPRLSVENWGHLNSTVKIADANERERAVNRIVLRQLFREEPSDREIDVLVGTLTEMIKQLISRRRRGRRPSKSAVDGA